jgi:hypothetical protein
MIKCTTSIFITCSDKDTSTGISQLQEIFLQETIKYTNLDHPFSELITCACDELTFGRSSDARSVAFWLLFVLYELPQPKQQLERLEKVVTRIAQKITLDL